MRAAPEEAEGGEEDVGGAEDEEELGAFEGV